MNEQDIPRWVRAAKEGDDEAYGRLVHFFLPMTERFLRQWVREQDVLDDIVQESFIKAWKHLGRFDEEKSFSVWLLTIAKRTAFDALNGPYSRSSVRSITPSSMHRYSIR